MNRIGKMQTALKHKISPADEINPGKESRPEMVLEAQLRFYPAFHINIFRTHDNYLVETVSHAGKMYHKTLISVTNQIGCPVKCDFCKVAEMGYIRNIMPEEYLQQVDSVLKNESGIPWFDPEKKVKVCFTRAGEALLNRHTFEGLAKIAEACRPSFQFTTVLPDVQVSHALLRQMQSYLSSYENTFQVNLSVHTSDEAKRKEMMKAYPAILDFRGMAEWGRGWYEKVERHKPAPRKANLSFVLMQDNEVNLRKIRELFSPDYFAIRFAMYLPSTEETAQRHPASPLSAMGAKAEEARSLGYLCIESVAPPMERVWDARPHSGLNMVRKF